MNNPLVYTPEQVATILQCSPAHVRAMCNAGDLPFFRLGGKLIRIRAADLEALTCPSNTSSNACAEDGASLSTKTEGELAVSALKRMTQEQRLLNLRKKSLSPASQ